MFCVNCGNHIPDDAMFCSRCGGRVAAPDISAAAVVPPPRTTRRKTAAAQKTVRIFDWTIPGIAATVLFFAPFGIPAVIAAAQANALARQGDAAAAQKEAECAKKWFFLALGAGIPLYVLIVFLAFLCL